MLHAADCNLRENSVRAGADPRNPSGSATVVPKESVKEAVKEAVKDTEAATP